MNEVFDEVYSELKITNDSLKVVGDLCLPNAYIEPLLMAACLFVHTKQIDAALEKMKSELYTS